MSVGGFRFRLGWAATGYTLIVNATSVDQAIERAERYAARRKAMHVRYLGETRPLPKPLPRIPYKVF